MSKNRQLLDDVLVPGANQGNEHPDLLLERTLAEVRRLRTRRARRWLGVQVAAVAGIAWFAILQWLPAPTHRAPVRSGFVQTTRPLGARDFLVTQKGSVPLCTSSAEGLRMIETERSTEVPPMISDADLLRLARDEPAALVRRADGKAELIMLAARPVSGAEGIPGGRSWWTR